MTLPEFSVRQTVLVNVLFFVCISAMMLPFQVRMIPLYLTFKNLNWLNSYKPLVIPMFFGSAYYIFLFRQFYLTIPQELSEAAHLDGCSELGIFSRIILTLISRSPRCFRSVGCSVRSTSLMLIVYFSNFV